ncbi:exopolysaccharide biosynthesis protein [Marinobacter sp.]|uniref:exopolysaccharide biosynthesis protein n=1 Tax=Marinobacter sp. TaxID=50741 RepID=UPI00384DCE0A
MGYPEEPDTIEEVLDRIELARADDGHVSVDHILDSVGRRSFGPVVMFVGIILVTPLSGVPGMPTLMGMLTLLTLGQLIVGREHIWLPRWLVGRQIPRDRLVRAMEFLRPVAKVLDGLSRQRLVPLVKGMGLDVMAGACVVIAFIMPLTEIVPFSSSLFGVALVAFGFSMLARDGAIALFAWTVTLSVPLAVVAGLS